MIRLDSPYSPKRIVDYEDANTKRHTKKKTYSAHAEFGNGPVRIMTFIQDGHLNVSVVDGLRIVRPVAIALLSALLDAPREHDDGPSARLPRHPPVIISGRMERPLRHDELARRVETLKEVKHPFMIRSTNK